MRHLTIAAVILVTAACSGRDTAPPRHVERVVDSIIPREEALRRFREGTPEVQALTGGAASRAALAEAVARALATQDTVALHALLLTRAEYAWLYYPTAAQGLPPYDLAPSLYWFTLEGRNGRALSTLLADSLFADSRFQGEECGTVATHEGENSLWGPCIIRVIAPGGKSVGARVLSLVIERGGKWKVVSYSAGRE